MLHMHQVEGKGIISKHISQFMQNNSYHIILMIARH